MVVIWEYRGFFSSVMLVWSYMYDHIMAISWPIHRCHIVVIWAIRPKYDKHFDCSDIDSIECSIISSCMILGAFVACNLHVGFSRRTVIKTGENEQLYIYQNNVWEFYGMKVYLINIKYYCSAVTICWWTRPADTNSYVLPLLYWYSRMYENSYNTAQYGPIRSSQVDNFHLPHGHPPIHFFEKKVASNHFLVS